nr:copia protein [Tanacetum cinerariifolium]
MFLIASCFPTPPLACAFFNPGATVKNSCVYDPNPNSFDCPPDSYHPPHPTYETYSGDSYGNDSQFSYDCLTQLPLNYEPEPDYIQNINSYPHVSLSFPQQYLCCDNCEGLHETFQCQPINHNFYNSNSSGFDQTQPPQFPVIYQPPQEASIKMLHDEENTINSVKTFLRKFNRYFFFETPKDFSESNNEFSLIDDDSFSIDNIDYVEATPPDSELVCSEVMEIVIPEVGGIDDDILLTIKDDILHEKLVNVNLLIAKIEALNDNPTPSSDCKTKSPSTSLNSLLEETNTSDNSLPEFETFCFDVEKISSGSTTTHFDNSLPEYEAFHDDHAKPTEKHLKEVKRIFRYFWGTVNTGLWYTKDSGFELTGFSDADYVGCKDTFKSTSGAAQFLREKLVSWSSKKQDCTALSIAKAEYVSLSACCAQVLWMRTQLTDYGFHFNKILIYCDSKSGISISCNPVQHSRTKHIAVRYHFIKEHVEKGMIELYFVKTDYQLANIFTKALPADRFNYLVCHLGMRSLSPKELERLAKSQ